MTSGRYGSPGDAVSERDGSAELVPTEVKVEAGALVTVFAVADRDDAITWAAQG